MSSAVRFIGVVLLSFLVFIHIVAQPSSAAELKFEISISPSCHLPVNGTDADRLNALMAANAQARAALSAVTVTSFHQEFPGSHYQYLRNIYQLTCADTLSGRSAVLSLHTADPIHFPYIRETPMVVPLGTYTPNDYHGVSGADCSPQLDYINAPAAWAVTKGNPNITIGINDPSGFDLHNPDLIGKIIGVDSFNHPDFHGTTVAGCAAAHTDNGIGVAAIGFDCTLDVDSRGGDAVSLAMSNRGRRIINNSWFYGFYCTPTYQPGFFVEDELIYDEIYENGTSTCFAAGNGLSGYGHCESLFDFVYPASLDHIITVGPTGHQNTLGTYDVVNSSCPPSGIPWLWRDCHEESPGAPLGQYGTLNYEANDRVDICAPAYNVVSTVYYPGDSSAHYTAAACGTSFASPIVCGALGLMLSANSRLSPYQLEYLLKRTARSMDYVEYPPGSGINLNQYYVGKMGAGALDAGAAVTAAAAFDVNDTATQTMYIRGIELNTICAPGAGSNNVNPTLSVIVDHGTPPYTYRWDVLPGNTAILSDYASGSPSVNAGDYVAFRLGVYDASPVPKEASRLIIINLTTDQTPKLVMRDSYMDMLDEPNAQANVDAYDWQIWLSPDIVNRLADDHVFANQNPVYSPTTPNYATARIRNVGCTASAGTEQLDLYWAKAGTGQTWPADWTTATFTDPGTGKSSAAGGVITTTPITIPVIQPGAEDSLSSSWFPPNPKDYDPSTSVVDISLLGRIETSSGMTFPEGANTVVNTTNNNRIATRNLIVNVEGDAVQWHQILFANTGNTDQQFSIEVASEQQLHPSFSGGISAYAKVEIKLGALYDRWVAAGSQSTDGIVDTKAKSIVFTGENKIVLKGIAIHANEKIASLVGIIPVRQPLTDQYFHIRQWSDSADYIPYGNVSFVIPACSHDSACIVISDQIPESVPFSSQLNLFPNPASGPATLLYTGYDENVLSLYICDISGQVLYRQSGISASYGSESSLDVSSLRVGLYFVRVTDRNNNSTTIKLVKD